MRLDDIGDRPVCEPLRLHVIAAADTAKDRVLGDVCTLQLAPQGRYRACDLASNNRDDRPARFLVDFAKADGYARTY